jgi:hypothetical protein
MSPVVLEDILESLSPAEQEHPPAPPLSFREIGCGYRPRRSFGLSVLAHQLALLAILMVGRSRYLEPVIEVKPQLEVTRSVGILVLPTLGGGSEGSGQTGGGKGSAGELSSGLRAQSRRGFAYPGPQPMVSSPARATLGIQTILQPSLENLPSLRRYVPLPNIVQPAPAMASNPDRAEPLMVVKSGKLSLPQPAETSVAAPKITLPVAADSRIADLAESKPQLPQRAVPDPVDLSEVSGVRKDQKGLLVLNAVPPPPDIAGKIPVGEARAQFAVSPAEATIIADPAAGTLTGGQLSLSAGSGSRTDIASGDTLAEIAAGGNGTNRGWAGSGTGGGGRYGSGQGSGLSSESSASGTYGRGTGFGPGLGTGSAASRGSGAGSGSAPGRGGFSGVTIQGGRYGNGNTSMLSKIGPGGQTSYNMTIVSTGSSGGGLPDFGVFQNEKVYTVYLDMRANDEDAVPSWTLQYAVLQPAADDASGGVGRIHGTPTPPYATLKEVPEFTPELTRKCSHQLIVASGIIDATGKLDQVSVRQSPESQLVGPLVEALKHWMFEPAEIDGRPVALKILLGIRLAVR